MNYFNKYNNLSQFKLKNYYLCNNPRKELMINDRIKYASIHNNLLKPGGIIQSIQNDYVTYKFHNNTYTINMKYCIIYKKLRKVSQREKMMYLLQGLKNNSIRIKK